MKTEPSVREVNIAEDITDRIFQVLIKSIGYVLRSGIEDLLEDEYDYSYQDGCWPNSRYMNEKRYLWRFDWKNYFMDDAVIGEYVGIVESKIAKKYEDKILPVVMMAKEEIIKKYRNKNPSLIPLVKKILDTVDIVTEICNTFDIEDDNFGGKVQLKLEAKLLD